MLKRDNTINSLKNNIIEDHSDIKIQELPFVTKINLRGNPNDKYFISFTGELLSSVLPIEPNTYTNNGKIKIIWLSPDEWLIVDENQNDKEDLLSKLQNVINKIKVSVTDVSENRTIIRISGDNLFILLSKFLVLDLDNNLTNQSSVAQTLFVKVPVLLVNTSDNNQKPQIDIFTNRSHANYIYKMLVDGTINLDF